jgi:hypothetical protein
MRKTFRGE